MPRLLWVLLFAGGCAAITGGKPTKKSQGQASRSEAEDDESGVKTITGLLKEFSRAVSDKDFDTASRLLKQVETNMENASETTRSHPDFEEVEERVQGARPRLEAAIERDRIERRNAAIDDLMRRGEQLAGRAQVLLNELRSRVPENSDVDNMTELLAAFAAIEREGSGFLDEQRYFTHAKNRDALAAALADRKRVAEWQKNAQKQVGKSIDEGAAAVNEAKTLTGGDLQAALKRGVSAFAACVNTIGNLELQLGYEAAQVIETRFGAIGVGETKKKCLETTHKLRAQLDKAMWRERVEGIIRRIDTAVSQLKSVRRAKDVLQASDAAIAVLTDCQTEVLSASAMPGDDPTIDFQSALGNLTVPKLLAACGNERARINKSLPTWRWRRNFEVLGDHVAELKTLVDKAAVAPEAAQIDAFSAVVDKSIDCATRAAEIGKEDHADDDFMISTPLGELDVRGIVKECTQQRNSAKEKLERALKTQKTEQFVQGCRGDEIEVARRDGVPAQIISVAGGRVFVYGKGKEARSFGFDEKGLRVDFAVKWREQLDALASELLRVIGPAESGPDGQSLLAGVEAALPVLDVCRELLSGTEKHPGFDKGRTFETPLGKKNALELRDACGKKKKTFEDSLPKLRWRVRLEEARNRAVEANEKLTSAAVLGDPNAQVEGISTALGGLRECVDRAQALGKDSSADKKLVVKSALGDVNASGLEKACKKLVPSAEKALDKALAAQKLQGFIETCQGDEVEVARREGIPSKVEARGQGGRVFVYESGKKKKRFAFDGLGKRVDEKGR